MIPVPTVAHNQALSGDTLYSAFLNYEWRQIVVPFIVRGMEEIAAAITDESERQAFEVLYGAMIEDFYNEDVMDGTPVGVVVWYPHWLNVVPAKWLRCEGQILNIADYPALAAILNTPIFTGGSTFTLPDLRNRFLYGAEFNNQLVVTGGAATHTLTEAEMPAHSHVQRVRTTGASGSNLSPERNNLSNTFQNSAYSTDSSGGGGAHNNMPPYVRGYWIMKVLP